VKIANTKLIIALYLYYLACQKFVKKLHFSNSTSEFLSKQNFFHRFQSDFRPGDSTVVQLIYIVNKIYIALEKGHKVRAVFLDISKAFDKVWHKGLLAKLKSVGISGLLYSWFESYLTNRYQHVSVNGSNSDWGKRRNNYNLSVPPSRTERHKKSFLPSAIRLWNLLPVEVRNCQNLAVFKFDNMLAQFHAVGAKINFASETAITISY
jgi:hypothetical protein